MGGKREKTYSPLHLGGANATAINAIVILERSGSVLHRQTMLRKTPLVVDDERSVRAIIIAVLQGDGFQTIEPENWVHSLELLNKLDGAVGLLVSDIKMPVMDGITLWSVLAEFRSIPVILVSGYAHIAQAKLPRTPCSDWTGTTT
jgi:CheY-like chemotaxis protein